MARLSAHGLLVAVAVLSACAAPVKPVAPVVSAPVPLVLAPIRADPTPPPPPKVEIPVIRATPVRPPQLWPVTKLRGVDYISARDLAARFDLKAAWSKADLALTLSDHSGARLLLETNQRDFHFDGLRVFLGHPVLLSQGTLWISKIDVIKIIAPLVQPSDHVSFLPAIVPRTIVLDPGHGGADPGTQNLKLGVNEKTFTLDVALRLRKILEARNWHVLLIRAQDKELSLNKKADLLMRDEFATSNQADLFLSIHFNNAGPAVTGVETYWMPPQFMTSNNDETGDEMTNVAYPGNRLDYANLFFGEHLHRAMIGRLRAPDRGFKHARKAVLRMLNCPGALVECAFLSNDAEARRVATPEYRQQIAEALAEGLQSYETALEALRPAPTPAK